MKEEKLDCSKNMSPTDLDGSRDCQSEKGEDVSEIKCSNLYPWKLEKDLPSTKEGCRLLFFVYIVHVN